MARFDGTANDTRWRISAETVKGPMGGARIQGKVSAPGAEFSFSVPIMANGRFGATSSGHHNGRQVMYHIYGHVITRVHEADAIQGSVQIDYISGGRPSDRLGFNVLQSDYHSFSAGVVPGQVLLPGTIARSRGVSVGPPSVARTWAPIGVAALVGGAAVWGVLSLRNNKR